MTLHQWRKAPPTIASSRCSRSVRQQAAGRDLLLGRILCRGLLDHGRDHAVVASVLVGRDLPVLAIPGLDAPHARTLVVGAGYLDRPQLALEAELFDAFGGEVEVLEAPAHLLAGERLLAEPLLRGADGLDAEHGVDQSADIKDLARLVPPRGALAFVIDVFLEIVVQLESTRGVLQGGRIVSLGTIFGR